MTTFKITPTQRRHGEVVLAKLKEIAPARMTTTEIAEATGLSLYKVYRGLQWVKEIGAAEEGLAYVYSRKEGHSFSEDQHVIESHEVNELTKLRNGEFRLVKGTLVGHLRLFPNHPFAVMAQRDLARAVEDIDSLLTQVGG